MERWTVLRILKWTADYFGRSGIDSPRLDAELLLAAALDLDRVGLYLNYDRPLQESELDRYRAAVRRRIRQEPVAYILGRTEFWSLDLKVGPDVLIPRADTEVLVEEILAVTSRPHMRLLDIGTGSGAIALAVAHERPDWRVTAIDLSPAALAIARGNADNLGLAGQITFAVADLAALPAGPFDLLVSNPPYIPTGDWQTLMPDVRDHEPRLALDGGADGLTAYRLLAGQAPQLLAPGGWLLVEVGQGQAAAVAELFAAAGLDRVGVRDDYAGIARVVKGCQGCTDG
ncbi:MAG: peptide chain release factor N(5)-glutamine methyltransferase [Desulfuromonadales bacterium]|nr:peptide chain release factor N(5)-glutamine methyltransferase [Desulfuromonadales bacterium]